MSIFTNMSVSFSKRHPSTGFHRYSSSHHPQLQIAILLSPTSWFPGFMGTKCKEIMQHPITENGKNLLRLTSHKDICAKSRECRA